ncbi:MAG TPA: GAF domain-containing protein [Anaerolineales bacterium]|nr:GAF domain-containing protein [Anaerolineales bacterium]
MALDPVSLGMLLLLTGVVFFLLVWGLPRLIPGMRNGSLPALPVQNLADTSQHNHAVMLVHSGGRVDYVNAVARQWLGLREGEQPNLEILARRVRPTEDFLKLCTTEGQMRFSVNGRPLEAVSYQVPGPVPSLLVSLRRPDLAVVQEGEFNELSESTLKILTDLSQSVAASLGLQATIQALLENVERLLPADVLEIKLWNAQEKTLTPYRIGSGSGSEERLEKGPAEPPSGYSAVLVERRQNLFIPETKKYTEALPANSEQASLNSYLGVPLLAGNDLVGTLEVGLTKAEVFKQDEMEILQLVVGQAAAAIRNASMLEAEKRRSAELSGLASLAQALGSTHEAHDLFTRLVESIAPLFDVEVLGFLVYSENRRGLEAQVPFVGMPAQVVELYHIPLSSGGAAEEHFLKQEKLTTLNAMEDELWREMGFQDYARAASWLDTALIPLISSGRPLGYLQISNHRNPEAVFSHEEMRLLDIVANQAAPIIENLTLVQQARQRAQRSEALRRIASLAASSATSDEIMRYIVQELARLLQADVAAIFLYDETRSILRLHEASLFGMKAESAEPISHLFMDEAQFHFSVTGSLKPFLSGHLSEDQRLLSIYQPVFTRLGMESTIIAPLAVREQGLGELMLASKKSDFFNSYDLQVVSTASSQLAPVLEGASQSSQTDESLRQRVDQLTELVHINRELNTAMDMKYLMQVAYDESLRISNADCGTILLFEPDGSGGEPKVISQIGEETGNSLLPIELAVLSSKEAIRIADFSDSKYTPAHDEVHSGLVVPISYKNQVAGLIHLHSTASGHFDQKALELVQTLAVQTAIAIGNARRFQEQLSANEILSRRAKIYSNLFDTINVHSAEQPLEQSLEKLAYGIQDATPFQVVLVSIIEPETMMQVRVAGAGMPAETLNALKTHQQPWESVARLIRPEYKIGQGYFIPHDQRPIVSDDVELVTLMEKAAAVQNAWDPEDVLFYPLQDEAGNPIGLISLDAPRDGRRPDQAELGIVEIAAAQAASIIQNKRRLSAYKAQVETLSTSLDRQQQLLSIGQSHLPNLLHKDLEQMISIRNLNQRARRIRAGLEITDVINRQVDGPSALEALGREILTRLDMSVSVVGENSAEGPRILHILGNVPRGTNPEALFGQRNPLRVCLQTGETLLVMNLDQDETWRDTPLLASLHAKGFICLPIFVDKKPVAGVLAISPDPLPALTEEDQKIYFQISSQVSIILQNISLLTETRRRLREVNLLLDFSRRLSGLDPDSIVKALLESALRVVTTAHAGVALLYDEKEGFLKAHAASGYANTTYLTGIIYHPGEALPGQVFQEKKPRRVDEVNFARDYSLPAEHLLRYREATAGRLPVSSLLVPIQTGEHTLGVLLLDNFNTPAAFTAEDEALLLSLTQQVALSLENVRLVEASQERATQLQALTHVSADMASSLKSSQLVSALLDSLSQVITFDTAILWLREGERMSVEAARGFPDNEERVGLTVAIADSALLAEMNRTSQGIVVGDVRTDARFPALVEAERLSWMGIPLVSKGEVEGVIALEKTEAYYFSLELVQLVTTFASQAAVALENARLYEESLRRAAELDERSQRLALLNRLSADLSGSLNDEQILRLTAEELQRALSAKKVSMVTFDRFGIPVLRISIPSSEKTQPRALKPAPIFGRLAESLGVFTTDRVEDEADLKPLADFLSGTRSLLILPLVSGQNLRALAFIHMDEVYHFSAADIDLSRIISNQAAVALESARLYQATVSRAEQLTTINRASYEIGLSLDAEEIYAAIHRAASQLMPAESFVIALLDEEHSDIEGVYLLDPNGRAPNQRISIGQGISGRVIATGEPLLIADAEQVEQIGGRTFGEGQPRSIVAVPIMMGGKVLGMLSAQSYSSNVYTEDEQQILSTLANQAAVAIQNGRLFAETRRLADELEQRVIDRTAELAREQRNTETLLRILTEASSTLDLDRALNRTLALLNDAIGAEQGSIMMVNPDDNTIQYRAGYGYLTPVMTEGPRPTALKIGEGLAGWVIKHREPVCIEDVRKDNRWVKIPLNSSNHRSVIAAPLIVGEDVIGAILVFHRKIGYFSPEAMNLVQAIGNQVAVAINNAQLYHLIRDQAERLGSMLRNQQVEASRQQAILEAVADGVLVTDPSNMITFLNSSAERILNLDSSQVNGQSLDNFVGLFGKASPTWMQTIHTWSEDPASHQPGDTYAEQLTLENGHVVLVHLAPVIWRNEFLGTVSIFRDITHEVEVDRLKSEFVATVSHELRTPMTSIKGYVDILLMGAAGALNENQLHFLDIVRANTERLSVLVNDLLDVSRIEAGRISLSLQAVDLREIANDVVSDIKRRSQEENKPMTLILDMQPELPFVIGDLERVNQIISNLVDNAYHYTPENGKITVHMKQTDDFVQVDVEDNGIGIDSVDAERIFERFFRGEDPLVLATPGTGLGLAIVKQLVSMHKGRIWMASKGIPGEGSTFSFTLPVYHIEEQQK